MKFILALVLALSPAPVAQPVSSWRAQPTSAVKAAAGAGDTKAAIEMGLRCEQGKTVPKDADEALKWFRKAAEKGDADAQLIAGQRLAYGPGPESDKVEAYQFFTAAAKSNNAQALYEVGVARKLGRGTPKDAAGAIDPLKRAAEGGLPAAQFELADCYETATPPNLQQAGYFYKRAADQNHPAATYRLGKMMMKGEGVTMDARAGLQLILKSAQAGNADAQWDVAQRFANGDGAPRDTTKAVPWLIKLSDQKHEPAQQLLARFSPDALRKAAKKLQVTGDAPIDDQLGALVLAEGTLLDATADKAKLSLTARGKQLSLDVAPLPAGKAKTGAAVRVYGTLADKHTLKGLLVDLEPPSFDWKYQLRPPGSLKAGESKTFVVDGAVKNTGKQTLRNVKIKCRLYQQNSPNDASGELTLTEIKPGQVLPFLFHVDFFNFQYLGATSAPKVEMQVVEYEF